MHRNACVYLSIRRVRDNQVNVIAGICKGSAFLLEDPDIMGFVRKCQVRDTDVTSLVGHEKRPIAPYADMLKRCSKLSELNNTPDVKFTRSLPSSTINHDRL